MKRYLILWLMVFGFVACASNVAPKVVVDTNKSKKVDSNATTEKKVAIIDLDKEIQKSKEDNSKGGLRENIIPIFLMEYVGDNDEVAFKEGLQNKINKIKIGDNDEVIFKGKELRIKTSKLKEDEKIIIEYGDKERVILRVRYK